MCRVSKSGKSILIFINDGKTEKMLVVSRTHMMNLLRGIYSTATISEPPGTFQEGQGASRGYGRAYRSRKKPFMGYHCTICDHRHRFGTKIHVEHLKHAESSPLGVHSPGETLVDTGEGQPSPTSEEKDLGADTDGVKVQAVPGEESRYDLLIRNLSRDARSRLEEMK